MKCSSLYSILCVFTFLKEKSILTHHNSDCADESDEDPLICGDSKLLEIIIAASIVSFLVLLIMIAIFNSKFNLRSMFGSTSTTSQDPSIELQSILEDYQRVHEDKENSNQLLLRLIYSKVSIESKKEIGEIFFNKEAAFHENDEKEIYNCLHNSFDPKVAGFIIDSKYPGFMSKLPLLPKMNEKISTIQIVSKITHFVSKFNGMRKIHMDTFKDIQFSVVLIIIAGGPQVMKDHPTEFASVIALCFVATIVVPLMISSFHLSLSLQSRADLPKLPL